MEGSDRLELADSHAGGFIEEGEDSMLADSHNDNEDDFVPDSLKDFLAKADAELTAQTYGLFSPHPSGAGARNTVNDSYNDDEEGAAVDWTMDDVSPLHRPRPTGNFTIWTPKTANSKAGAAVDGSAAPKNPRIGEKDSKGQNSCEPKAAGDSKDIMSKPAMTHDQTLHANNEERVQPKLSGTATGNRVAAGDSSETAVISSYPSTVSSRVPMQLSAQRKAEPQSPSLARASAVSNLSLEAEESAIFLTKKEQAPRVDPYPPSTNNDDSMDDEMFFPNRENVLSSLTANPSSSGVNKRKARASSTGRTATRNKISTATTAPVNSFPDLAANAAPLSQSRTNLSESGRLKIVKPRGRSSVGTKFGNSPAISINKGKNCSLQLTTPRDVMEKNTSQSDCIDDATSNKADEETPFTVTNSSACNRPSTSNSMATAKERIRKQMKSKRLSLAPKIPSHPVATTASKMVSTDRFEIEAKERAKRMEKLKRSLHISGETNVDSSPTTFSANNHKASNVSSKVKQRLEEHKERMRRAMLAHKRMHCDADSERKEKKVKKSQVMNPPMLGKHKASQTALTVPVSPNLTTMSLHGERVYSVVGKHENSLEVNPINRAFGSSTNASPADRISSGSVSSLIKDRGLTIPRGPHLSTQAKYGDKPIPTGRTEKQKGQNDTSSFASFVDKGENGGSPSPRGVFTPRQLTKPIPFKLHESKHAKTPVVSTPKSLTLAESVGELLRKGFRGSCPISASKFEPKLTNPISPKLSSSYITPKRPMPKSTAELEEEMMAYNMSHLFKANPIGAGVLSSAEKAGSVGDYGVPKVTKRSVTTPSPFCLSTEIRGASYQKPLATEEIQAAELEKRFYARPMPDLTYRPPPPPAEGTENKRRRTLTTPRPFNLKTDERHASTLPLPPTADEIEMTKKFHARPAPNFSNGPSLTTAAKRPIPLSPMKNEEFSSEFHARPMPDFGKGPLLPPKKVRKSDLNKFKQGLSSEQSPIDSGKQPTAFHARPMPDFSKSPLNSTSYGKSTPKTVPQSPILSSARRTEERHSIKEEARHAANAKIRGEKMEHAKLLVDEAEQLSNSATKGVLLRYSPKSRVSYTTPSRKELTVPRPFTLRSITRSETYKQQLEERVRKEEEEERQQYSFKARAVPESIRNPPRRQPKPQTRPITEPQPFHLACDVRHEIYERELLEELEQKESDRTKQFKARPLPLSTFKSNFLPSKRSDKPLVEPRPPLLRTERQAKARKEYDVAARTRRDEEKLLKKNFEEGRQAEKQQKLKELRRLPVSEGGLIPVAQPVNAVFHEKVRRYSSSESSSHMDETLSTHDTMVVGGASLAIQDADTALGSLIAEFEDVRLRDSSIALSSLNRS